MVIVSSDSALFTRALRSKIRGMPLWTRYFYLKQYGRVERFEPAERADLGLIPANLYIGGVTRPRDLRAISWSRGGHFDRSLFPDTGTPPVLGRVADPSRTPSPVQVLPASKSSRTSKDTVETTLLYGVDASLLARSALQPLFVSQQTRSFHTSSRVPYDSTSYNVTDVPDFFIQYKQYRATTSSDSEVCEHKPEELGLMQSVTDLILLGDIVATTRRLEAKIPVEHHIAEGHVIHPSGFIVPGPGHTSTSDVARAKERERNGNKDRLVQTAAVAYRVLESNFEQVDATTLPLSHKVPFEVREPDGTIKHPSGFVPPTPAHKFRYSVNSSVLRERKVSAARQRARQPSPSRVVLRAVHTGCAPKASRGV